MTTKEHLSTVRRLYRVIAAKQANVDIIRGRIADPRTAKLTGLPCASGYSDRLSGTACAIVDRRREIDALKAELKPLYQQAAAAIKRDIADDAQRAVLTMYYLEGKGIGDIQVALDLGYRRVMDLHDRGVRHLRIMSDDGE